MRTILLAAVAGLGLVTGAGVMTASPAAAGILHPVCMEGPYNYIDCHYDNFAQCNATASGLGADCHVNPAYVAARPAYDEEPLPPRRSKRAHRS